MIRTRPRGVPPHGQHTLIPVGPWRGVRDVGDAGQQDPSYLQDAINCYFEDANGGIVVARPGFQKLTSSALNSAVPISSFCGYWHTDGTHHLFAIASTKLYRQSGASAWTDVTPAAYSFDSAAQHMLIYNGELIVTDGAGEPWRGSDLLATPITRTEIEINTAGAAWFARGAPTVHGGKLFFIVEDIGGTKYSSRIVWSEEASAGTGYLQDGFTNSWDLIQAHVSSERILAIQGTNTALYYFRNYSIGAIYGAVNAEFSTTSTHDGVSASVGMALGSSFQPPAVLYARDYLWFLDSASRPVRLRVGSTEIEPLWKQMRRKLAATRQLASDSDAIRPELWQVAYAADVDKVAFKFLARNSTATVTATSLAIFNATTGSYEGRWRVGITSQPADDTEGVVIRSVAALPRYGSFSSPTTEAAGDATFVIGTNTGDIYQQTSLRMSGGASVSFGDDGGAMHMSITPHLQPDELVSDFYVDEAHVEAGPDSATLSMDYYTPRGSTTGLTATGLTGADSIQSSHDHGIFRYGLRAMGRWFRPVWHWNVPSGSTPYFFERAMLKVRGFKATGTTK